MQSWPSYDRECTINFRGVATEKARTGYPMAMGRRDKPRASSTMSDTPDGRGADPGTSRAPLLHYEHPVLGRAHVLGGRAAAAIQRLLTGAGLEEDLIRRVCIASYEAEMNVVLHASFGVLTVDAYEDRVLLQLDDHGPGIADLTQARIRGWSTASSEARNLGFGAGLGLTHIQEQADEMVIESEPGRGVHLVLTFWRRSAGGEQ